MVATMLLAYPGIAAPAIIGVEFDGDVVSINEAAGVGLAVGPSGTSSLNSSLPTRQDLVLGNELPRGGGQLFTINPASGVRTPGRCSASAVAADVRGLAFSAANVLFAINNTGPAGGLNPDDLFTINVAAGAGALIGATGLIDLQGLDFAPDGTLYGWDISVGLVTIDPATGAATDVNLPWTRLQTSSRSSLGPMAPSMARATSCSRSTLQPGSQHSSARVVTPTSAASSLFPPEYRSPRRLHCSGSGSRGSRWPGGVRTEPPGEYVPRAAPRPG
jgi:hypothetical protein